MCFTFEQKFFLLPLKSFIFFRGIMLFESRPGASWFWRLDLDMHDEFRQLKLPPICHIFLARFPTLRNSQDFKWIFLGIFETLREPRNVKFRNNSNLLAANSRWECFSFHWKIIVRMGEASQACGRIKRADLFPRSLSFHPPSCPKKLQTLGCRLCRFRDRESYSN